MDNSRWDFVEKWITDGGHILIGGMTGSGKSVLINDIIFNILTRSNQNMKMYLIDPKKVELRPYKNTYQCMGYVDNIKDTIRMLDFIIQYMDRRYTEMAKANAKTYPKDDICYVIIDELADLMLTDRASILPRLQKIAQLGRACKIRLLCATQSPSRKVIPAELTLNFGIKIALHCDSAIESRQIVNMGGAEMLPKYGKALVKCGCDLYYQHIPITDDSTLQYRIDDNINPKKV